MSDQFDICLGSGGGRAYVHLGPPWYILGGLLSFHANFYRGGGRGMSGGKAYVLHSKLTLRHMRIFFMISLTKIIFNI